MSGPGSARPCVVTFPRSARHRVESVRISSFCTDGSCVGVVLDDEVTVVDTKTAAGPELHFTRDEWAAFVAGVKAGEFDV